MSSNGTPARREFEVTLPIGYTDEEGSTHRRVVLRKMTGREEAILADRKYARNGGKLVTELLHSCIVRIEGLEPNGRGPVAGMFSADRNYLLLRLRSITFGSELRGDLHLPGLRREHLDARGPRRAAGADAARGRGAAGPRRRARGRLRRPRGPGAHRADDAPPDRARTRRRSRRRCGRTRRSARTRCSRAARRSLGEVPTHRLEALGPADHERADDDRPPAHRPGARTTRRPGVDLVREIECPRCAKTFSTSLDLSNFLALA